MLVSPTRGQEKAGATGSAQRYSGSKKEPCAPHREHAAEVQEVKVTRPETVKDPWQGEAHRRETRDRGRTTGTEVRTRARGPGEAKVARNRSGQR